MRRSKLPKPTWERNSCDLHTLANEWGWTTDDILYMGKEGKLELCVPAHNKSTIWGQEEISYPPDESFSPTQYENSTHKYSGMLALYPEDLQSVSTDEEIEVFRFCSQRSAQPMYGEGCGRFIDTNGNYTRYKYHFSSIVVLEVEQIRFKKWWRAKSADNPSNESPSEGERAESQSLAGVIGALMQFIIDLDHKPKVAKYLTREKKVSYEGFFKEVDAQLHIEENHLRGIRKTTFTNALKEGYKAFEKIKANS